MIEDFIARINEQNSREELQSEFDTIEGIYQREPNYRAEMEQKMNIIRQRIDEIVKPK